MLIHIFSDVAVEHSLIHCVQLKIKKEEMTPDPIVKPETKKRFIFSRNEKKQEEVELAKSLLEDESRPAPKKTYGVVVEYWGDKAGTRACTFSNGLDGTQKTAIMEMDRIIKEVNKYSKTKIKK